MRLVRFLAAASLGLVACASDSGDARPSLFDAGIDAGVDAGVVGPDPTLPVGTDEDASVRADAGSGLSPQNNTIVMKVRDFRQRDAGDPNAHPDFESPNVGDDRDMVEVNLGADRKPVYRASSGGTRTTDGKARFDQWYRDVPNVNVPFDVPLVFTQGAGGIYSYDSDRDGTVDGSRRQFFPIDNQGFGNQGNPHNFHFTGELHTAFTYRGGETFRFRGDDDVWVFINGQRVIDLGGTHTAQDAQVSLDALGLTRGRSYPLDFFFAERHTVDSNLLIETTIVFDEFQPPR